VRHWSRNCLADGGVSGAVLAARRSRACRGAT
jgi:hypothetical protein